MPLDRGGWTQPLVYAGGAAAIAAAGMWLAYGLGPLAVLVVVAACALVVSDMLTETVTSEESYLSPEDLARAVDRMIELALATAARLD